MLKKLYFNKNLLSFLETFASASDMCMCVHIPTSTHTHTHTHKVYQDTGSLYSLLCHCRSWSKKSLKVTTLAGFPGGLVVENPSANAGDTGDVRLIPGSVRSPGEGNGNPFQYSCPENRMDGGAM